MAEDQPIEWVLPARIPFEILKARDLEECVFWLFDALGARDLEWRTGGTGGGAADGGRDLEATFYAPDDDGEMQPARWWVECKGRKHTVEADAVKSACNNAMAEPDLDTLVIVTNSTFSNPTRDWVKTWQAKHPLPKVRLWDKETLERELSRQPSAVLRLFAEALSPSGRLEALRERFWNKLEYVHVGTLKELWSVRETLDIGPLDRMALIANECAHGDIIARPWAGAATPQDLFDTFQIGVLNLKYLWRRTHVAGSASEVLVGAFAYLIVAVLQHADPQAVARHILMLIRDGQARMPDFVLNTLLMPILDQVAEEMRDVCSADCRRFSAMDRLALNYEDPLPTYWYRHESEGVVRDEGPQQYLRIEHVTQPCKVGFLVDEERSCPLFEIDPTLDNVAEFLAIIEKVSGFRLAQARAERHAAKSPDSSGPEGDATP